MITGVFHDDHPHVTLTVSGESKAGDIDLIVDTGCWGDLTLPQSLAGQLDLPYIMKRLRRIATGEVVPVAVHAATIEWNDEQLEVEVLIMEGDPLLGTRLLRGMLLQVEGIEGGDVVIEPL